jgi:hypothetical protein
MENCYDGQQLPVLTWMILLNPLPFSVVKCTQRIFYSIVTTMHRTANCAAAAASEALSWPSTSR